MWQRLGPGPVFTYESLLNARRWQVYASRSFFVLVVLLGMVIVWLASSRAVFRGGRPVNFTEVAKLGEQIFYTLAGIQLALVMLAAPAAAAGSMCIDRVRGTLEHTMVTDLSDVEIVLGKLAARVAPIAGMIMCGLPVAALAMLLGGVESQAIAGTFAVSMSLAVLGCVLALTISIWAAKTYEALLAVYVIEAAWLISLPIWWSLSSGKTLAPPPVWFEKANPFVVVFAPYAKSGSVSVLDYALFAGGVLAVSAVLTLVSIVRLRPAILGRAGRPRKGPRRLPDLKWLFPSWPSPSLDDNPVLWREWHYNRQSRLTWWIWTGMLVLAWSLASWGTYKAIDDGNVYGEGFSFAFLIVLFLGFLMLSAMAPTALAEERASGSLDVLLATPLSTAEIVTAKWWGVYRKALVLAPLALYVSFFEAAIIPDIPAWYVGRSVNPPIVPIKPSDRVIAIIGSALDFAASSAVVVSWGLALATWIRRSARALTASVIAFFVTGIGWVILLETFVMAWRVASISRTNEWVRWLANALVGLSPIFGPMMPVGDLMNAVTHPRDASWIVMIAFIVLKAATAGLLLWLTIKTFDRCVGRVSDSRRQTGAPQTRGGRTREELTEFHDLLVAEVDHR